MRQPAVNPAPTKQALLTDEQLHSELGWGVRPQELAKKLSFLWPEVTHDLDGTWHMSAEDEQALNEVMELFGLTVRTDNATLETMGRAYDVCVVSLSQFVNMRFYTPADFEAAMANWPQEWANYIRAVASADLTTAKTLAARLQVLDPDCVYPPGVVVPDA